MNDAISTCFKQALDFGKISSACVPQLYGTPNLHKVMYNLKNNIPKMPPI